MIKKEIIETEVRTSGFQKVQSDINESSRKIDEYRDSLKRLEHQKNKLISVGKKESEEYRNIVSEISSVKEQIKQETDARKELMSGLNLTQMSYNQLKKRANELTREMKNMSQAAEPEQFAKVSAEFERYDAQIKKLTKGMRQLSEEHVKAPGIWGNAWNKVKNYLPAFGISSAISSMLSSVHNFFSGAVPKFREYDEALTDAMKTTDQSKEGIIEISEELRKIDTRSSQNELLDLSRIAGKVGKKSKEDVVEFVKATDKVSIALKEDLGGNVETTINEIGKLVDIFHLEDQFGIEQSILKVGSAINEAGAASTANEGYIVEFSKRVAGIAPNADISIQNVIGLAATLDRLGQRSETSATVYGQVINKMYLDTKKFANLARMDVNEFTTLLNQDANAAFVALLKGLKGNSTGMSEIVNNLDDMSVRGAQGIQIIGTLVANIEKLEAEQTLSNKAFEDGTSILKEYEKKNQSAEAISAKLNNQITTQATILGEKLNPIVNSASTGLLYFLKALVAVVGFLIESKGAIIGLSAVYLGLITVKKLSLFYSTAHGVAIRRETINMLANTKVMADGTRATATYTLGQKALIAVKALLAGQFRAAGVAARAFWVSLGPIGWATAAFIAIASAIAYFGKSTDKAAESSKKLNDVQSKVDGVNKSTDAFGRKKKRLDELIGTYNELKKKTDRSNDDNVKLQQTISDIVQIMPNAASVFDAYGKAIDISTGKINKAIEAQRKFLMYKQRDIIDEAVEGAGDTMKDMQSTQSDISNQRHALSVVGSQGYVLARGGKHKDKAKEGLIDLQFQYKQQQEIFYGYIKEMERLSLTSVEIAARLSKETGILMTSEAIDAFKSQFGDISEAVDEGLKCKTCGNKKCTCPRPNPDDADKKKWSLESDAKFGAAKVALRKQLLDGQIATEQEYSDKLLSLEISTLESRLSAGKLGNDEILKLEGDLADKRYTQRKNENDRLSKLAELIAGGDTVEKEKLRFEKQKQAYGLHIKERKDMTADELKGLEILELEHNRNLSKIYMDGLEKKFKLQQNDGKRSLTEIRLSNASELKGLDTFAKKKVWLKDKYSADEYRQIITSKDADKAIKAVFDQREADSQKTHLSGMLETYVAYLSEYEKSGTILGKMVTEEDVEKLKAIIANLKEELAKAGANIKFTPDKGNGDGVDIFGMTPDKWEETFTKLKEGKAGLDDWGKAIGAVGQAMASTFGEVSNLMTAIEQREFAKHEKMSKDEKKRLDKQLNAGVISQEAYNRKIQNLDEKTDAKRQEMEKKQAERQKAMAIFDALVNTAVAVVGALGSKPFGPWNIALAATIGALGAIQVGTIMAQPLPGAEDGGMLVERSQDGKRFNAEFEPAKRGRVDKPTVIVGENGSEYVVPAEGYENPTIRPVLDIIEMARKNGTLRSINLPQIQTATMFGRQSGGYVSPSGTAPTATPQPSNGDNFARFIVVLERTEAVLSKVDDKLSRPFPSYVTINGPSGLAEQLGKYNKQKDNGRI